ncbi:hypothetical protein [Sphingomicrobium aestuariivivum]|uniref:hypothetical protein n=1 Tax=Sphingomicrobium aestuariivivum TaxID=1582356 RepID=UPI001FD65174|nr:hypothetical protein [Sphingomicrobium aestuariivivum]MCJ8191382.1 hypothetical protein [Sphingomicrobium aestuariivivum]
MPDQPLIPVLCDLCRARGAAGDDRFAELAELLAFTPVPVKSHANTWTGEHQRAFIAALATTGNVRPAARAIGRWPNGAERLRKHPKGRSFAEAWDNALDLYRERELALLKDNLEDLAAEHDEQREARRSAILPRKARGRPPKVDFTDHHGPDAEQVAAARAAILERLQRLAAEHTQDERAKIMDDPDKRAAWEVLYGKVDWEAVREQAARDAAWRASTSGERSTPDTPPLPVLAAEEAEEPAPETPTDPNASATIEQAQAKTRLGERHPKDYRDVTREELIARGFEQGPGGMMIKRL